MAKAQFQKGQKVWVEAVGVWAVVEKVQPVWAKGFDEPVRVTYEVGLGREFAGAELSADAKDELPVDDEAGAWRLMRARNKWQSPDESPNHPFPGSYPVVVTDVNDWGGWRVPGAEYDRDPERIERQARLIAAAPRLLRLARDMVASVAEDAEGAPPEMMRLARAAETLLRAIHSPLAPQRSDAEAAPEGATR